MHLTFLDEDDIGELRIHDRLVIGIAAFIFIHLELLVDLLLGNRPCLCKCHLFTWFRVLLLLNVVDEEGTIFTRRE